MDSTTTLRYQGYSSTPLLWNNEDIASLKQLHLKVQKISNTADFEVKNHRLGKLVEDFVYHQLQHQQNIKWIADSIQIQHQNTTIGELDALCYLDNKPIHIEVIYKFYLYDTLENYDEPLLYWIGPNRNDSLCYKLNKLKNKQLPLLHHPHTKPYLEQHNLKAKDINQYVYFKAQLFLPYNSKDISIKPLNTNCINGFYISFSKLELLKDYEFYIPEKLDWLVIPYNIAEWLSYKAATNKINAFIIKKRSPLVWLKSKTNDYKKCFITWW